MYYTLVLRVRWWRTVTGRAFMAFDFAVWILFAPLAAELADPGLPAGTKHGLIWMIITSLLLAPLVILYRIYAFERKRRGQRQQAAFYLATLLPHDHPDAEP